MTSLISLSAFLLGFAVFYAITGKNLSFKRSVRYKDERIETSKVKRSTHDIIIIICGSIICAGIAMAITGTWYYTLLGMSGGYFVLKWWKKRKEIQQMEMLQGQFAEVLGHIESAIYGGLNPYQALEEAVPVMPRPARDVFYEIMNRVRNGYTLAKAIETVRIDTKWEDLKVLSVAMNLYNTVGCDLSQVCRHALETIEEKENSRGLINASISQVMVTLSVLSVLPFLVVGAARAMSPQFTYPLFYTVPGGIVLIGSVFWIILGNVIARKMVNKALGREV